MNRFASVFVDLWSNGGSGNISGWITRNDDRYFAGDVDGDGADELICFNPYGDCAAIFKYINGNFTAIYFNNCNGYMGGWNLTGTTTMVSFNFNNGIAEEIFAVDSYSGWAAIKNYGSVNWTDLWANSGNHFIGNWQIQNLTNYVVGNFNTTSTSLKYLHAIKRSNGSSSLLRYYDDSPAVFDNSLENEIPEKYLLSQNYPNPFNPQTTIKFEIPFGNHVKLSIYNMLGQEIKTLINEYKTAGKYLINLEATDLSSGNYFYKIETGNFIDTKKLTVLK